MEIKFYNLIEDLTTIEIGCHSHEDRLEDVQEPSYVDFIQELAYSRNYGKLTDKEINFIWDSVRLNMEIEDEEIYFKKKLDKY